MADAADIFDDTGDAGWADDAAAEEEVEAEEEAELTEDEFAEDEDAGAGGAGGGAGVTSTAAAGGFVIEESDATDAGFMAVKPWKGACVAPSDWSAPADGAEEPDASLELAWVHGYRCRGVRQNVGYTSSGDIVYPAAAVGIVANVADHTQAHFRDHVDDVLSLAVDSTGSLVATGSKATIDDKGHRDHPHVYVWEAASQKRVSHIHGFFKKAVSALAFSPDGKLLAGVGADNDHWMGVHDVATGKLVASAKTGTDKILGIGWNTDGVIVTVGVKHCVFWEMNKGSLSRPHKGLVGSKGKRCSNLCVGFTATATWTGTATGDVYVWKGNRLRHVIKGAHGKKPISSIVVSDDFVATGGSDNKIQFWTHKAKPIGTVSTEGSVRALALSADGKLAVGLGNGSVVEMTITDPAAGDDGVEATLVHAGHFDGELWGLALSSLDNTAVTCGDDNLVCKWDLDSNTLLKTRQIAAKGAGKKAKRRRGASTMSSFHPNQCARAIDVGISGYIAVGTNDGRVRLLDENLEDVASAHDAKQWIQVVKFDPTGDFLAVGSHDGRIDIYDLTQDMSDGNLHRKAKCLGHQSFIEGIDWDEAGVALQSTCGAYELLFWDADTGEQDPSGASALRDETWASFTCKLGWSVWGIWPSRSKGSDINTLDRADTGDLLAVGFDTGRVKLFKYPCYEAGAKSKSFAGHSSHLTRVKFNVGSTLLATVGGNDNSLLVWNVV